MKKRIFVDTNVLLDVLLEREGFYYDALKIWASAELGKVEACIAAISLNNVHYVMRRLKSETTAMIAVKILMQIFKVVSVDADIVRLERALKLYVVFEVLVVEVNGWRGE